MEQEHYVKTVVCSNCKKSMQIKIPKGVTVDDYLKGKKTCPNCGCETLYYGKPRSVRG